MDNFRPPESFSFEGADVADRWKRWEKQFETYFTAFEVSKKPKKVQVAMLLHCAGAEAQEIHEQFEFAEDESDDNYKTVLQKFREYCHPRKNKVYERYRFWSRDQIQDEPIDK